MADKHGKFGKRNKKFSSKAAHDLTLEDVLAVGGDKVSIFVFQCTICAEIFFFICGKKNNLQTRYFIIGLLFDNLHFEMLFVLG